MFFWNSLPLSMIRRMVAIWCLVHSSAFSKSILDLWKFSVHILEAVWKILSITLLACEMSTTVWWIEHSLALPFFGIGRKQLFLSCGHFWVFQVCWYNECSIATAASFTIWNILAGIPSPPRAMFLVMLPKAHLTSHSRTSGSRWMIIPSRLSLSFRPFLCSSFVYSCTS